MNNQEISNSDIDIAFPEGEGSDIAFPEGEAPAPAHGAGADDRNPKEEPDGVVAYEDFDEMGLPEQLLRGVYGAGFEKPSAIQKKAIVASAGGRDIIMHAQSGTGKSGAFTISLLQRIDTGVARTQALILSPTRDLALQTQTVVDMLGSYMDVKCHASVGGRHSREDRAMLERGPHVVTGTPGRVLDNIERRALDLRDIRVIVLDEVDVMLSEGFREQVYDIFTQLPPSAQAMLVSATFPEECAQVTERFLKDPVKILIPQEEITLDGISQFYVDCGADEHRVDVLFDLYEQLSVSQSVVFVNTRRKAMWLADVMNGENFTCSVIHGELSMPERELVLREFKNGASRVLIATDIVARGIDVQQVSMVLNFEMSHSRDNYIHRIGRGGRMGRKAVAINLVTDRDARALQDLERYYSTEIREMPADISTFF